MSQFDYIGTQLNSGPSQSQCAVQVSSASQLEPVSGFLSSDLLNLSGSVTMVVIVFGTAFQNPFYLQLRAAGLPQSSHTHPL